SQSTASTDNVFDVLQVASPGARAGSVAFAATSRFAGAQANLVRNLAACENYRVDMLAGFRFLELDESIGIETRINALSPDGVIVIGGQQQDGLPVFRQVAGVLIQEEFRARNQFYGGQLGLRGEYSLGKFSLGLEGKVAFGPNHEQVDV